MKNSNDLLHPSSFILHPSTEPTSASVNVARRLTAMAERMPDAIAVAVPHGRGAGGRRRYASLTFRQLDDQSDRLARGLRQWGVVPGTRLALLVPPSLEFFTLVFALFKAGAITILIDPGMGRRNLIACLAEAGPEGFVAIPLVQAIRRFLMRRFHKARFNVTVGRRWLWDGITLEELRAGPRPISTFADPPAALNSASVASRPDDPAAIIFTTGSTGPPKGVLYTHGNFDAQVAELGEYYDIQPGEIDLPGFPLFALFNAALGVTTVVPDMDPTRPARVDPRRIVEAVRDWQVTQAFGSPAIWNRVGPYCRDEAIELPSLKRVLSAGAPVPPHVLARMKACIAPQGEVHTPYGATEALPVASISASEVLGETSLRTREGAGVCVGRKFPRIRWKVIRIVEGPIAELNDAQEMPSGEIGELIVAGPVVTRQYVTRLASNALAKIADGSRVWHRMGDVGYLDGQDRFWFCGRLAHRVLTGNGPMYTICCEAIFNDHPSIYRSALVGIGAPGSQRPVLIAQAWPEHRPRTRIDRQKLLAELRDIGQAHALTHSIHDFLLHAAMPVDIRHNAKIFREKLAIWAARELR